MFPRSLMKPAIIHDSLTLSYRALRYSIYSYGSSARLGQGERAILFAENSIQWIIAFYSTWYNHAVTVPCDYNMNSHELAEIINDCSPSIVFCDVSTIETAREAIGDSGHENIEVVLLKDITIQHEETEVNLPEIDHSAVAVIIYTSGTTGKKKGVMLTYDNLRASIDAIADLDMLTENDRMLGLLPFYHIFPLQGTVTAPLFLGSTVVMVTTISSDAILAALQKHPVTMFLGIPRLYELFHNALMAKVRSNPLGKLLFMLATLVKNQKFSKIVFKKIHDAFGGQVHSYLTGGAKMDPEIARNMWLLGFRLVEGYGLTETGPLIAFNPYSRIKLGSVGLLVKGTEVKIENDEIIVRGPNVMKGYYNDPEATGDAIIDGWFHTGDIGSFDEDGYLYVTGRKDEMIVLPSGKNINPEEIEKDIVRMSPMIKEIGVMQDGGRLTAVIYPDFSFLQKENIINIIDALKWKVIDKYNARAASYKRIFNIVILKNELPRTRLGKLQRFLLKDVIRRKEYAHDSVKEPDTNEYRTIRDYLNSISGEPVMPNDHIVLDIGLDSLSIVELQAYIENTFGIIISNDDIIQNPTVTEITDMVINREADQGKGNVDWHSILSKPVDFKIPPKNRTIIFSRSLISPLIKWYFNIEVENIENVPRSPFIITPNHQSYLDSILLGCIMPSGMLQNSFFLAKDMKIFKPAVGKKAAGLLNTIIINVDMNLKESLQKMATALRLNRNIVIFPEGVRSRDGKLGEFKKSFAILSRELNVPVVPVTIDGAYDSMPRGKIFPRRVTIRIRFHSPVTPVDNDYEEIRNKVYTIIKDNLKE